MAKYRLTSPSGEKFEITAPDDATEDQVMQYFHENSAHQESSKPLENQRTPGLAKTIFDQGLQGATFGFADEVTDRIGARIAQAVTGVPYADLLKEARTSTKQDLSNEIKDHPLPSIAANIAGGLLTGGAGATTKTGASVGNSLRTGNLAARVGKGFAAGATSGATYGTGSADDGERLKGAGQGLVLGGIIGGTAPALVAAGSGLKNAVFPKVEQKTRSLALRAREFGIPLRTDQISPSRARKTLQKISQELPFSGVGKFEDVQRQTWNSALAKTIGQESVDVGPETIIKFVDDASHKFNDILAKDYISISRDNLKKLDNITLDADETITADLAAIVRKNVDKLLGDIEGDAIGGEKLASFRSNLLEKIPNAQQGSKQYLSKIIDFIDDVVGENISPEKAQILSQARREWRNFKTIEPLLEKSTDGQINPVELLNRVKASKFIKASRTPVGEDDLVDLARIGKQFLPKQGGSDTFQKSLFAGSTGALGVTALSNPLLAATIATKGAGVVGANRAFQGYNQSQRVIDLILDQISRPQIALPNTRGVLAGNLANQIERK